jgi:hypothetical protein
MKRLALTAPTLLIAACATATNNTASTVTATETGTLRPTATQTVGRTPPATKTVGDAQGSYWSVIDNDGTFLVGVDIAVGKYRSAGGPTCYWARLHSPDPGDVVDSKKTSGPQVVVIRGSDTAFLTRNCGTWQQSP